MIPKNITEAHDYLEEHYRDIFLMTDYNELWSYHNTLGRWIRNNWGLWRDEEFIKRYGGEKSPLREHLVNMGFTHADDMSSVIVESFWYKIRNMEYDFIEKIKMYKEYWNNK